MRPRGALALLLFLSGGCSRACGGPAPTPDASEPTELEEAAAPVLAPERCSPLADPVALDKNGGGEVVGDVVTAGDVYIASVRHGVASVGKTTLALGPVTWTDLGPTLRDAPPPELVTRGGQVFALFWERADAGPRSLVVARMPTGERMWTVREEEAAESMAIDAAFSGPGGLLAWDSSDGVRVASLVPSKPVVARLLAGGSSARVVPRDEDGYVVEWTGHKIDTWADGAAKTQPGETIEAPGESRSFEWLELARFDLSGQPKGAPQRITSETGHVGQFDVVSISDDHFDVYARDGADPLGREAGGRILRITVHEDRVDSPVEIVGNGVGPGSPSVLRSFRGQPWLFFEDASQRTRAVPISAPDPRPSLEASLDDVRVAIPLADDGWLGVSSASRSLVRVRCTSSSQANDK